MPLRPSDIARRLGLWTLVRSVSAAPSFLWAAEEFNHAAMVTGVALFILLLTAITCTGRFERFKRRPFMRRTLYIGYGARVGVSFVFPVGMLLDMYPGLLSLGLVSALGLTESSFLGTLLVTLVQGTILNILLSLFMLVVYGFQRIFCTPPAAFACAKCGYDLRGSTRSCVCPECGVAFEPPSSLPAAA